MKEKATELPDAAELRRRAEARLRKSRKAKEARAGTKEEMQRLFHELQVHQIELELQNEELAQSRSELESVLRQYTDLYDFAQVGYFTLDRDGKLLQVNLTGARLLGVERARLAKRRFGSFASDESRPAFNAFLENVFKSREKETCELTILKEGHEPLYLNIAARISENEQECRAVATDITARKQAELELRYVSIHDALTGLYNRGYFEETMVRLEHERKSPVSIVVADVDGLKKKNDREGHAAGDELLKRLSQVLTAAFRAEDIVARIGGDEFAMILPDTDAAAAEVALRRLQQFLQEHNDAYAGTPVRLSVGASTAEILASLKDVFKRADDNMYREKQGRVVAKKYSPAIDRRYKKNAEGYLNKTRQQQPSATSHASIRTDEPLRNRTK